MDHDQARNFGDNEAEKPVVEIDIKSRLLKRVSKASRTSALFFSCLVGFIEFFLAGKTIPFALHMRQSDKQTSSIFPASLPMCFSCVVISSCNTDSVQ